MEALKLFAPYGPGWLGGVLLVLVAFYFGRQFLDEYKAQTSARRTSTSSARSANRRRWPRGRSATASARRWRAASPARWRGPTASWRP